MKALLFIIILVQVTSVHSLEIPYYGQTFYQDLDTNIPNKYMKKNLFHILNSFHVKTPSSLFDNIVPHCPQESLCYKQEKLSYSSARKKLFGYLHLEEDSQGYYITDVYCEKTYHQNTFPTNKPPGPGRIPSAKFINTEHTWPQSRFSRAFPKSLQKGDLHALFPVNSRSNSVRGNIPMGEPIVITNQICPNAARGHDGASKASFEPPDSHKGNTARALFYFSVRYQLSISEEEEAILRKWHLLDPVDSFEKWRHQEIYEIQKNRNPFIDHPDLVNTINDF